MDDEIASMQRGQLDAELAGKSDTIGVRFGRDLYSAFVERGWFARRKFVMTGTDVGEERMVYGSHPVYLDDLVDDLNYQIGGP